MEQGIPTARATTIDPETDQIPGLKPLCCLQPSDPHKRGGCLVPSVDVRGRSGGSPNTAERRCRCRQNCRQNRSRKLGGFGVSTNRLRFGCGASSWGVLDPGRPGLALVVLSVVEQPLDAVRAGLAVATVTEAAAQAGCRGSRCMPGSSVISWRAGFAGLADRTARPRSCVRFRCRGRWVAVAELCRRHPRLG
jgi:hypothetical protein